ncbi:hypothetical protein FB451DRAFT_1358948 [Mycena latifolia]|nr:hypothetical protein FB451DRAFT_1358948 [Mycena latifolia]
MKGSLMDKHRVVNLMLQKTTSDSERLLLFPVFYANLDPAAIPTAEALDTLVLGGKSERQSIQKARLSLSLLRVPPVPPQAAIPDIWDHAWPWMDFLHTYSGNIPELLDELPLYSSFIALLTHFQQKWRVEVGLTPGVRVVVGRAWVIFLKQENAPGLKGICDFLCADMPTPDTRIARRDDLVDGAGGTFSDLASTIVRHLEYLVADKLSSLSAVQIFMLGAIFDFVVETINRGGLDGPYEAALMSGGLIGVLTRAGCALHCALKTESTALKMLRQCFALITQRFQRCPGRSWVAEACEGGLLRMVALSMTLEDEAIKKHLKFYIGVVLPPLMVYHSVLAPMAPDFLDIQNLTATIPAFPTLLPQWHEFAKLANDRLTLLKHFHSGKYIVSTACDNVKTIDLEIKIEETLGTTDRSFLRALIQWDFNAERFDIFLEMFLSFARGEHEPVLQFNYTDGSVSIHMIPVHRIDFQESHPEWNSLVSRVANSHGRAQLQRVVLLDGVTTRARLLRMRSSHSKVYDGLVGLAAASPPLVVGEHLSAGVVGSVKGIMDIDVQIAH